MRCLHLVLTSVLVSGCGIADFDVVQPIPEQQVQGSGIPAPLALLFPLPLDLDLSAQIQKQTTGPIDSVTLTSLTLAITDTATSAGDTDDWSFVDEIHVFVKSSKSGTTLPRVEIASTVAPGAITKIDFTVDDGVNLQPYVSEGSVVESMGTGRIPGDDVSYDGTAVFTVHPL
jgi:hypothetical protein